MTDISEIVREPETLIERLRNPLWVHSAAPMPGPQLSKDETLADMKEAADALERCSAGIDLANQKREFAEFEWNRATEHAQRLEARLAEAVRNFHAIKQATIDGRVCDDVAWFDTITTLHDFCELAALNAAVKQQDTDHG